MSTELITALQSAELYDHDVESFQLIETHISQVILTGEYAYKIKKPVDFGFLDFSTLEKRHHFCKEELRLNQRLAPDLYLNLITITGTPEAPVIDGDGPVLEYAIKMKQFPQEGLFDKLQAEQKITSSHIAELGQLIAHFHLNIEPAPADSRFGTPDQVYAPVNQNFEQIREMIDQPALLGQLENLEAWAKATFDRLQPLFEKRKAEGFIRECHGDIHLGNITLYQGKVVLFDCIEFNDDFRWTDTMSDLAFILMDLQERGLDSYARTLLNQYLAITGDYDGLALLHFYQAYRAMVRAKIALFTRASPGMDEAMQARLLASYTKYADLAETCSMVPACACLIGHGVSGSGKSTIGKTLIENFGAIHIRSDAERKRLFDLAATESSRSEPDGGIYTKEATQRTYQRLHDLAQTILQAGYTVFIDATNLLASQRDGFQQVAEENGVPGVLISCQTDENIVRQWITQRQGRGQDASEATLEVLDRQLATQQPLTAEEKGHALVVDAASTVSVSNLVECLKKRLDSV
ncbi:MAG: hypothetical protein CSA52_01775 [Gammaproteobacteria bacterium]|nr:MAG: hypothetical protein CSB48_01480 [Pseudomonadota bacterium]PIE38590.1 MAG: hypothetical protein CSA52_01775 [Gammaproteobacteria bacterium]